MRRPEIPQWRRVATPVALAMVSLLAALILWIAVTDAENPQRVDDFGAAIGVTAINVPEGQAVTSIPPVRIRVSADASDFDSLTTADFQAQVDLSNWTDFSVPIPVQVRVVTGKDVGIVSVSPGSVLVTVEPSATKQVPVRPRPVGRLPQGFSLPNVPEANPTTVRVSGARSLIDKVESVTADVNLTGLRTTLTQQISLVARDNRDTELTRLRIEPNQVEVKVTVVQQEISLQLPILAAIQGTVADGYNITSIVVEPSIMSVTGTIESIFSLTSITTEPIDVSGLKADFIRAVRLRPPTGIQTRSDTVNVRVRIEPIKGEMLINIAPQVTNLENGRTGTFQTSTVTVRVTGEMPTLRTLTPGSLRATVSAAGKEPSVYVETPQISGLPQGVEVVSIEPAQVVLVIE